MFWNIFSDFLFVLQLLSAELIFLVGCERRKYFWIIFTVILGATALIFIFIPSSLLILQLAKYLLGFVLIFLLAYFCFDTSLNFSFFVSICAYAMQHAMYCTCEIIRSCFDINGFFASLIVPDVSENTSAYLNAYYMTNAIYTAIIYAAGYIAMFFIFIKKLRNEKQYVVNAAYMLILSGTILLSTMIINLLYRKYFYDLSLTGTICFRIMAIVCCAFAIVLQLRSREKSKMTEDNEILDRLLREEAKHHEMSKANIEIINVKCHDLKKQINTLRLIASDEEKAKKIAEIENAVLAYDNIAKTGNEALDVILTEKSLVCGKENIKFNYIADGEKLGFMQKSDVYSLFGNALDNAIEGLRKVEDINKRILSLHVEAVSGGGMLFISVSNYFEGEIEFENGLPKTRNDGRYHGFGMLSMKRIAENYGGNMLVKVQNNCFELKIIIPIQKNN